MPKAFLLAALALVSADLDDDVATLTWRGAEVRIDSVAETLRASGAVKPEYAAAVAEQVAPLGP